MSRINSRTRNSSHSFKAQEIANIVWSFATLNAQPASAMLDAISSYIASECRGKNGFDEYSIAKMFKRQELCNLAWSCAVLGRYPEDLMKILYTGIVGTSNDPERMRQIFNDNGLQRSSIMTLYYVSVKQFFNKVEKLPFSTHKAVVLSFDQVQVAAGLEASKLKLSLPIGFPIGWGEDVEVTKGDECVDDLVEMSSSMLTLTVSKLQQSVSDTFTQIGFDNVLEYVIDTNEIKDEYGVHLPPSPQEFLSIDIANIEKRIAIEVDGPGHYVRIIDGARELSTNANPNDQFADHCENRVNGPTTLKHRLLSHLGWDIIHLPYWEYQNLGGNRDEEMAYCKKLLEQRKAAF